MATQNITNLALGTALQIFYTDGMRNQISREYGDWEMIKGEKISDPRGRQINFYLQKSLGIAAVQTRQVGEVTAVPRGQKISTSEHTAHTKEIQATVELDYNVYKLAAMSKDLRYIEPLEAEMKAKLDALKRVKSLQLHLDGTGVMGQLPANSATVSGGNIVFQLSTANTARGHVGAFQFDDILILREPDGTASALDTNLATEPVYFQVVDRNFENDTVTLQGLNASFAAVTISSISVQPGAGEVFYRYGQQVIPDLTAISDYATASDAMIGLDSLTAADGRVVHGITMSGATKGSRYDAGDVQLDVSHFEAAMNNVKINVGQSAYAWKKALLAPEVYSQFILGRETDRRFNSIDDVTQGARKWVYQHRNDAIELYSSEFAKKKRVYILPEAKQGQGKVLEYYSTDFEEMKAPNEASGMRMKSSASGGIEPVIQTVMNCYDTLICKHPAAVAVIHNFTLA